MAARAEAGPIFRSSTAGPLALRERGQQAAFRGRAQEIPADLWRNCAYGVAQGYLVKIDPNAWRIVNDRLYLNYHRSVARTWLKDVPGYVRKADANWPKLVGSP